MAAHTALARQLGYTEVELQALDTVEQSSFDPELRTALRYAEQITRDAHTVTDAFYAELKKHYSDTEILELTCVIGLSNYFNRFTTALKVDLSGTNQPYDAAPAVR